MKNKRLISTFIAVVILGLGLIPTLLVLQDRTQQKSQAAISGFQPNPPFYTTFFYPWYENPKTDGKWSQWTDLGHTPPQNWFSEYLPDPNPSVFDPATELYSSNNDQIIYWQLRKLAEAKQEVAISSWWGQNHKSDIAFRKIVTDVMNRSDNPYPNLRWALYYEKEGFGNPSLTELLSDLNYIKANYTNQPGYFKINGKPVIFVYNAVHTSSSPLEDLNRWKQVRAQTGFYVVMKSDPLNAGATASDMDSWHEYAPAIRTNTKGVYWYMVSPGFWLNGSAERLSRNAAEFENGVKNMVSANVTWKLTETWNEWGEGSGVEPAEQVTQTTSGNAILKSGGYPFKNLYVDILNRNLPPLEQGTGQSSAATPTPTQAPSNGSSAVIVAAGDIAPPSTSGKYKEVSDLILQLNPNAVLALGDTQYENGELTNFLQYYDPTWGRFAQKTYPAVGNHEYLTANAQGYFDYFTQKFGGEGNTNKRPGARTQGYYAFNVGQWRIYALNSNCSKAGGCVVGSPQEQWLKADLAANPRTCSLMFYHHPYVSSDTRNFSYYNDQRGLWNAFYTAGGDVVLVGHSHFYERFAPMNPDRQLDEAKGIRQIIVGTGGKNVYNIGTKQPLSLVNNGSSFGVLKMILNPTGYSWEYKPVSGSTFTDSGTSQCVGATGTNPPPNPTTPPILTSTPTIAPNNTRLNLTLKLHGLGNGGDNANANSSGNFALKHLQRSVIVEIINLQNQIVLTKQGSAAFNSATGRFIGQFDLGTVFTSGTYRVKVKVEQFLQKEYPGSVTITKGQLTNVPEFALVNGDATKDNRIDILDYNLLMNCYSDLKPAINCSAANKLITDFTDDGNVNSIDYNLFIRELINKPGA